ncbi:amidase [Streptomyces sp. AV19]|uniref:amidase n=1 Tax=Streptomyces sp. AV19 TaxID=2793068 RepID=UPI0018FECBC2|nr:amidase family protein [Streptomyces sp. AV19]MBH1937589.1 amidase [Streptomyces sp. AV19]MDG4536478.1 amidase family protein [Streptomyces sp. AV19]
MKRSEYVSFDAVGLADLVARGEVSPPELEQAALAAADAVNPRINAVVETWPGEDVPVPGSTPLAGVPFLIKDLGVTMAGKRAELGSRLAAGVPARADSSLMRRFRRAGLVTFGRTSSPEMGFSLTTEPVLHGATLNPWDTTRSAGGSSGGAAAAVAAGIVPVAHATDAGGSIRVPAAYNGLFGLKSTRARVSPGPDVDEAYSGLAVHGSVSRTVRDSAALLDRIQGPEAGDAYVAPRPVRPYLDEVSRHPGSLRIGVLTRPWGGRATTAPVADAVARTVALLERLGHRVEEATVELGASWEEFVVGNARLWCAHLTAMANDLAAALGRTVDAGTLEPVLLACYAYGRRMTAEDLVNAFALRNKVSRSLGRHFSDYDVLLTPTLPELPLPLGSYDDGIEQLDAPGWLDRLFDRAPFAAVFNIAGTPAMSVPLESDPVTGLPVGMQFAAGYGQDDVLFRLAGQLERARPWSGRVPEVWAGADAA